MTLTTDSSVGVQSQGAGGVGAGADLTISAGDEIDIRHDARTGTAPPIHADGALSATAANGISVGAGNLTAACAPLSLAATAGGIGLHSPHGPHLILNSSAATTVPPASTRARFPDPYGTLPPA